MIEAVLFDIDGTLLDHDHASRRALHLGLERERGEIDEQERRAAEREWRRLEELHYEQYLLRRIDLGEQRRRRVAGLLEHLGAAPRGASDLDRWFQRFLADYRSSWRLFDDVLPAIAELKQLGAALGVITNADARLQRAKLEGVGIAADLPAFTASSEAGASKPEARIFRIACERLGLEPSRVAYVGDRLETDARGAARAGLALGVWIRREGGTPPATDTPTIRSLSELRGLLLGG